MLLSGADLTEPSTVALAIASNKQRTLRQCSLELGWLSTWAHRQRLHVARFFPNGRDSEHTHGGSYRVDGQAVPPQAVQRALRCPRNGDLN
eukprot:1068047-Amphidinium_carterae.2